MIHMFWMCDRAGSGACSKMRIFFLIRSLNLGGAQRQLVVLAKGLQQRGHMVAVIVFYPGGFFEKELKGTSIPVISLNKRGRWDTPGFVLRLVKLLRHHKPDVLNSYLGAPNILTALLKPLFPRILMVWGVRASNMDLRKYDRLARLIYRVECWFSRFADLIIVNSYAGLSYAATCGFSTKKMIVIPNGIDTEQFKPSPKDGRRVRKEWNVPEHDKLIGLVGRLDPMKDHPTFLRAAALLLQKRQDVRFACVGDGRTNYQNDLFKLGEELGLKEQLIWTGARRDMPAVYNALDILTTSSYSEGFPNVIGEGMACGVPCVVTDAGDSEWIVRETGIVVPPGDPQSLADGWQLMLTSLNQPVDQKTICRQRIVDNFSANMLIELTEDKLCRKD